MRRHCGRKRLGLAERTRERGKRGDWRGGWGLAGHGQELGLDPQSHREPQKACKQSGAGLIILVALENDV